LQQTPTIMNKKISTYFSIIILFFAILYTIGSTGCANIIPPGGGPKDSLPPVLVESVPRDSSTNFTGNRITLNFDEYVDIQNTFENVLVSPTPNSAPIINNHLRTVSIRIKDTLEPNTTYSIDFGNALRDINEGNVFKNFTYVFSTGNTIDQNTFSGKVVLAETGKVDSTLIVVLHRNFDDSAVAKEKPRYIAKLDGKGNFQFRNLPEGRFAVYAIPNEYSKRYDDSTRPFAFANRPINTVDSNQLTLYAFTLPKVDTVKKPVNTDANKKEKEDKVLRLQLNLDGGRQDLLEDLTLTFNKKIATFDSTKVVLTDTTFRRITDYRLTRDTSLTSFTITNKWEENQFFILLVDKAAFADSAGATLRKSDTVRFVTKRAADYGSIKLRFFNLDLTKNPVVQIVQSDKIVESIPVTGPEWNRKLFPPGDYELRVLYDSNKNGVWDTGRFFGEKRQPETVISLNTKLTVRPNWDNEKDLRF
jgi:hypothetical protein